MFEKILTVVVIAVLIGALSPKVDAQSGVISFDHVSPLAAQGRIPTDMEITFYLRLTNDVGSNISGITNGFMLYSPDGAEWTFAVGDTLGTLALGDVFDLIFSKGYFSGNGQGADSVSFSGSRATSTGLPVGFDDTAYTITIGPIGGEFVGYTFVETEADDSVSNISKKTTLGVWGRKHERSFITSYLDIDDPGSYYTNALVNKTESFTDAGDTLC